MFDQTEKSVNNQKGVYYIKNDKEEIVYVGYTNASFVQRWTQHIDNATSYPNCKAQKKLYKYLYDQLKEDKHIYFGVLITADEIKSITGKDDVSKEDLTSWETMFISRLSPRFNIIDNTHLKNSFNENTVVNMANKEYKIDAFTKSRVNKVKDKLKNKQEERVISVKEYAIPFKQAIRIEPQGRAKVEQNRMLRKTAKQTKRTKKNNSEPCAW